MKTKQHTIREEVTVSGVGLHTGVTANMTFTPAGPNHGIKFQRIDLPDQPIVDADVDNVVDLSRGTTIEQNGARINTVEHTLAALVGLEIDNVLIKIDGPEPPILDGSSRMFIDAIEQVGTEEQNALRNFLEINESIMYRDENRDVEIAALPLDDYRVTVMVDYNSPVLGSQHASLNNIQDFKKDISSSRTFCFLHELEMLHKNNLIKGGDLNNAIVVVDRVVKDEELDHLASLFNKPKVEVKKEGILNNVELRHRNEPARHKLLDVVGDLALVGRPIKAQILAARPGHAANVAFAKKLKKAMLSNKSSAPYYDPTVEPVMDINQIMQILPHRYPFLLIDKIIHLDDTMVAGIKNVTMNEPFFTGHFPGNPVMPGVLQIEAMAQIGGILVLNTVPDPENYTPYFLGIDKCKFRKMVVPGDTIKFKCELTAPIKRGIAQMNGYAYVGNTLVCEAAMTARIVKNQ
ncbi:MULTISPECIES: bifunctional UDP-3-O-[3-hydroxymyristoyl] N-acetylglucosamine deacetylase/3-hydroxyacyl-ACP dehydratase [Roseivirga]|jgi:UDP-3-O-[3-hydroxymyristoyl] N-acetylglucosamine deacetylase/3-hydroxyacyl-[acyl-carrier-protein] dehydratase|uniref:Multifunctional fusion protein n=1 Tax=Roseivirga spongicola TaxID=333140 RepID=A0A150XAJ3_9BACT|nr:MULTISPECIES: bifunctional UDP-3-O-[3-hydroxymyristoyl] N-acetylglucosamine deacetylase/3-hydroxyacyl-ACP dehydratase [Roseivirga]PWL29288.1 MAG: bifunctional UDP-3-O-[3-hydroxymyristoyl] N-acetylglucosamine deacetylase/3-hydroxyacyl-ACP dehydratase [Roseivirga sp. XM-24bin3]KYG75706.1 UDP-3-O-[3-hydroxymyristoyl] N-acetylglucosamine deacetylase [Roseivirga spongicola]MBO6662472.1 bifunctional UDP-3-O-[3-hydroxymyristoyl] N-acetylglucosamine deacetylase/3-hydroxyacyl-ACP dehydratase [Roseivir